jgi:hypothetical protein
MTVQCVRKVAVHLGYGTYIWLSVWNLPLKCAVDWLYSVVKRRLKCNTGKVCNCLIQFLLNMVPSIEERVFISAQRPFEHTLFQIRRWQIYRVIYKSVKHFKNSQKIDYATDHGNSYADRERNFPSFFKGKALAHSCPDLPVGDSSSKYGVQ